MGKINHPKNNNISFDWESAHKRISHVTQYLSDVVENNPGYLERIWAQRAKQLANATGQAADGGEKIQIAFFQLGQETFGIEAQYVSTIRLAQQVTNVPRTPKWVAGVTNFHGRILSVLDLQNFFNFPPQSPKDENFNSSTSCLRYLVVVETPDMEIAFMADKVFGVESIPVDQMRNNTNVIHGIPPDYVKGTVEYQIKISLDQDNNSQTSVPPLVVILNIVALLAEKQLIIHEEIV